MTSLKHYHKMSSTYPWYSSWHNARARCVSRSRNWFKKGIKFLITLSEVEILWFRDNASKLKKPSLDRKDNDGHYSFENCRFIEHAENARLGNIGNKNKLGKFKDNVSEHALKMRTWRENRRKIYGTDRNIKFPTKRRKGKHET